MDKINRYRAKKIYSRLNPLEYELKRFETLAGKIIDKAEKETVFGLLKGRKINKKKSLRILDVATGTGRLATYIKERIPSADVSGVDINTNMLKLANKRNSDVQYSIGDLYNLPFKDGEFDVVVGLRFSMHLPDLDKVFSEFSRVLRNDGIAIFDIFNLKSILCLKYLNNKNNKNIFGFYKKQEIVEKAHKNRLEFLSENGILLLGESIIRRFPHQILFLTDPLIRPANLFKSFSTKLILCFRKH